MATYTIKDTAPVVYTFTKANLKKPLISILPYALACGMITAVYDKTEPMLALAGSLAELYIGAMFAINIYRAYLQTLPPKDIDLFNPTIDDWLFIWMSVVIGLILQTITYVASQLGASPDLITFAPFIAILSIIMCGWIGCRLVFVLPDRAIGGALKLQQSFMLTRGLVSRIYLTLFAASWKILLACFGWCFVAAVIRTGLIYEFPNTFDKNTMNGKLVWYFLQAPGLIFLTYWWLTAAAATIANFYLWAKENRA